MLPRMGEKIVTAVNNDHGSDTETERPCRFTKMAKLITASPLSEARRNYAEREPRQEMLAVQCFRELNS